MPASRRPVLGLAAAVLGLLLAAGCRPVGSPDARAGTTTPTGTPTAEAAPDGRSDPVADPVYPQHGNPALDVLSYALGLSWAPATRKLTGTATLTIRVARPVTNLSLDFASSYTVDSVTVDGTTVDRQVLTTASRHGDKLVVPLPGQLATDVQTTLVVAYHGAPRSVPMPSDRSDFTEGLGLRSAADGSAWTMQEPFGAFTWYPANDQPSDEALYDIRVTVPAGWAAVSHGTFLGIEPGTGSASTYHWRSTDPVASYLATLAIGHYTELTDTGPHALPITYWIRTGLDEDLTPALRRVPDLIRWLEQRFGPYPFASAGVVVVDSTSAMETQQMVTLGAGAGGSADDRLDRVTGDLLHELAHQWFGDAVTPRDWRDVWLNEGFAMYAQWLWSVDAGQGTDDGWESWARARDKTSRAVAGPPGHWLAGHFAENNIYVGPALMLHEIHHQVGDQRFFQLCQEWVQTQRNQPVDRAGFTAFVNRSTGTNFTDLINRWLDSPTTPAS